ncbi:hypothetical protein SAMN05216232_0202 [Virgibacillus subterraneus]|uniref:Uncharacterized protein n=1 Tax=Virgibacillus subterraneus TaxID=621109 RepID=A0A1H8YYL1_9BACI|nr:hypothetical protein SAMN05216232_0202 [Virgibacillus subterraneus]
MTIITALLTIAAVLYIASIVLFRIEYVKKKRSVEGE